MLSTLKLYAYSLVEIINEVDCLDEIFMIIYKQINRNI